MAMSSPWTSSEDQFYLSHYNYNISLPIFHTRKMGSKPTFLLLNEGHSIPVELGPHMLGALCKTMEDPISCWKPDDAANIFSSQFAADDITHQPQMVTQTAKMEIDRQHYRQLGGVLQGFLKAMWSKTTSTNYQIDSQLIRTVRLPQHKDMFKALLDDKSVQEFREEMRNERYFMITGYKSCVNGLITRQLSHCSKEEIEVDIPLGLLLTSFGVPVPPGLLPQISANGTWTTNTESLSKYLLHGENIFAFEYKEVLRYSKIADLLSNRRKEKEQRRKLAEEVRAQPKGKAAYDGHQVVKSDYLKLPIPSAKDYLAQSFEVDDDNDPQILGMEMDPTAVAPPDDPWIFIV